VTGEELHVQLSHWNHRFIPPLPVSVFLPQNATDSTPLTLAANFLLHIIGPPIPNSPLPGPGFSKRMALLVVHAAHVLRVGRDESGMIGERCCHLSRGDFSFVQLPRLFPRTHQQALHSPRGVRKSNTALCCLLRAQDRSMAPVAGATELEGKEQQTHGKTDREANVAQLVKGGENEQKRCW
jgi:hypothetical protein